MGGWRRHGAALLAAALLPACVEGTAPTADPEPAVTAAADSAGICHAEERTPARIETVTEQRLVTPERRDPEGRLLAPASYRTETRQRQTGGGEMLRFRTPCPAELTSERIGTLQRALAARGLYGGPAHGRLDSDTRRALRRYQQQAQGLDSATLSLEAARSLGLVAWQPEAL